MIIILNLKNQLIMKNFITTLITLGTLALSSGAQAQSRHMERRDQNTFAYDQPANVQDYSYNNNGYNNNGYDNSYNNNGYNNYNNGYDNYSYGNRDRRFDRERYWRWKKEQERIARERWMREHNSRRYNNTCTPYGNGRY